MEVSRSAYYQQRDLTQMGCEVSLPVRANTTSGRRPGGRLWSVASPLPVDLCPRPSHRAAQSSSKT